MTETPATSDPAVYPASPEYGSHYFSSDETVPSKYGRKCQKWCYTNAAAWEGGKCLWAGSCDGCSDQCAIPKYVEGKKNVLLIMTDDLNVDVDGFEYGHPQAYTPNIKKLAEEGTRFDNANTVHPLCTPSRATFMTGIYGINSHNMFKDKYYENAILSKSRTWVEMFKLNGYYTVGTGKLGHNEKPDMFTLWGHEPNYGPLWRTNGVMEAHPSLLEPLKSYGYIDLSFGRLSDATAYITDTDGTDLSKSGWTYEHNGMQDPMRYASDDDRDRTPDEMNADFAIEQLENNAYMKFASWIMGVGFVRPHTPLHAPDKYFDYFDLNDVIVDESVGVVVNDSLDTTFLSSKGTAMYSDLVDTYGLENGLKRVTHAYLACIYAVDDQIGRVLTALDDNEFSSNTIIVFLSDHGWHNGQKQVMWKNTAWEQGARIPLIIKDPAYPPGQVQFPVSLIDIFPTLMDLAGLEITSTLTEADGHVLDGYSLKPFLENSAYDGFPRAGAISIIPQDEWAYTNSGSSSQWNPKVFTYTVRMKDYRYIMVKDGTEELYNHAADPYELTNLLFTSEMATSETQQAKEVAMTVLNGELSELGATLDASSDPTACSENLWVNC